MTTQSRQGKHREGKSSIGIYIDDDTRALLALTSDQSGRTGTDILISGIVQTATALGIVKNGKVVAKYAPAIELIKAEIIQQRAERKART